MLNVTAPYRYLRSSLCALIAGVAFWACTGAADANNETKVPNQASAEAAVDPVTDWVEAVIALPKVHPEVDDFRRTWEGRLGRVEVGLYGEILPLPERRAGNDAMFHAWMEGGELVLGDIYPHPLSISTFARVTPDGTIRHEIRPKRGKATLHAPKRWPRAAAKSVEPLFPLKQALRSDSSGVKVRVEKPEGAITWLYRNAECRLISPPEGMDPFPNVIWVLPDNGGFRLIHSGPEEEGDYARIAADNTITYFNTAPCVLAETQGGCTWNIRDEQDKPAWMPGVNLPADLCVQKTTATEDGGFYIEGISVETVSSAQTKH